MSNPDVVDFNDIGSVHGAINDIMDGKASHIDEKGRKVPVDTSDKVSVHVADPENPDFLWEDETIKATGKEAVGSLKNIIDVNGVNVVVRKQDDGLWAPIDSPSDLLSLTSPVTSDILQKTMQRKPDTSLLPNASEYVDEGFNVLLRALHGVGKTETIMAVCEAKGLKMKYFSCSTLDPFTDLVGVPVPLLYCPDCDEDYENRVEHRDMAPHCKAKLERVLRMVRPKDVDDADIIFFDEFNRGDDKTMNAVFEIIQFRTINGEPLPNLRCCWAAINPPDKDQTYTVNQLDVALLDRFDIYVDITPKPSTSYMMRYMPEPIARTLKLWWDNHQQAIRNGSKDAKSDYISPRRLMKLGLVWCATDGNVRSVMNAFPIDGNFEKSKLTDSLKRAWEEVKKDKLTANPNAVNPDGDDEEEVDPDFGGTGIGDRPAMEFTYRPGSMRMQQKPLSAYLKANPDHEPTHRAVIAALKTGTGGEELVRKFGQILDSLNPSMLEGMIAGFQGTKIKQMRKGFTDLHETDPALAKTFNTLYKVLDSADPNKPSDWPAL